MDSESCYLQRMFRKLMVGYIIGAIIAFCLFYKDNEWCLAEVPTQDRRLVDMEDLSTGLMVGLLWPYTLPAGMCLRGYHESHLCLYH